MRRGVLLAVLVFVSAAPRAWPITLSTLDSPGDVGRGSAVAYGPNGLALISYVDLTNQALKVAACQDAACRTAVLHTLDVAVSFEGGTSIAFGGDGRALISYQDSVARSVKVAHCADAVCSTATLATIETLTELRAGTAVAAGADGLAVVAYGDPAGESLKLAHCSDAACSSATITAFADRGGYHPSATLGGDGRIVAACDNGVWPLNPGAAIHVAHCTDAACTAATFVSLLSGPSGGFPFTGHRLPSVATGMNGLVWLAEELEAGSPPATFHTTVMRRCADAACTSLVTAPGSAAGGAYDPALAMRPGDLPLIAHVFTTYTPTRLNVTRCPDAACNPAPMAPIDYGEGGLEASVAVGPDGNGLVAYQGSTTRDLKVAYLDGGDLTIGDAAVLEGDVGMTDLEFQVLLSRPAGANGVRLDYVNQAMSGATPGVDFLPASGTLTIPPGGLGGTIPVHVIGDMLVEPNEDMYLNLSNPQGALLLDRQVTGTLLNDDTPLGAETCCELEHGSRVVSDLAASPGPDTDYYRLAQDPFASYEILVDDLSADVEPVQLERTRSDGTTVLQSAVAVGTGACASLRWRTTPTSVGGELIRVRSGGCQTDCGPDDRYRLRAYDTTLLGGRFNNTGAQATVLIVQNRGTEPVALTVYFWSESGHPLQAYEPPSPLAPMAVLVLSTPQLAVLGGRSGGITIAHTGAYGGLAAKATAIEPTTGFSFDSPLAPRPR